MHSIDNFQSRFQDKSLIIVIQHCAMRLGRVFTSRGICGRFRRVEVDGTEALYERTAVQKRQRFDKIDKIRVAMKRTVSQMSVSAGLRANSSDCGSVIKPLGTPDSTDIVLLFLRSIEVEPI